MTALRGLEGFHNYKDIAGPGIGLVSVMKNDRSEFLLRKTLDKTLKKHFNQISTKAKRLLAQSFQQVVFTSGIGDELYFEFSKRNLEDHLNACLQKDMVVSEEDLWSLMKNLTESGHLLEKLGEYHPSLTLQNIFRLNDRFKLLNPYVFDSYIDETIAVERLKGGDTKGKQGSVSKTKVNLVQVACIVLCMGVLISEKELKAVQKEGHIARLLLQFQERYSARFANIVEDVVYRRIDSFAELLDKLEGGSSKRDSVKTEVGISPPIDFNSDIFTSMADSRVLVRPRDKARVENFDNFDASIQGGKRFLGADGGTKTPTRKPDIVPTKNSPQKKTDALLTEEGDYKLIENKDNLDYRDAHPRPRESHRRVDFERDVDAMRGAIRLGERLGYSSVMNTPKTIKQQELGPSKSSKELTHNEKPTYRTQEQRHLVSKQSESRIDKFAEHHDPPYSDARYKKTSIKENGIPVTSDSKRLRHTDEETKASSAQNFYSRKTGGTGGEQFDRENRVAAIYSRLNKRFKQYQVDEPVHSEGVDRPIHVYDHRESSRIEKRFNDEPNRRADVPRNSKAVDEGLYSPFDWSNTKKKIREEGESKVISQLRSHIPREPVITENHRPDRFRLHYQLDSFRESPKTLKNDESMRYKSTLDDRSGAYRTKIDDNSYDKYLRRNPSEFNRHMTDNPDLTETDKKKNRSVSFNLCNNSYDLSRSFTSKMKGPKSILKKAGQEDGQTSGEKPRRQHWKQETDQFYSAYSQAYLGDAKSDFKIEAKYMGTRERPSAKYYQHFDELKAAADGYVTRSPGYRDLDFRRDRKLN